MEGQYFHLVEPQPGLNVLSLTSDNPTDQSTCGMPNDMLRSNKPNGYGMKSRKLYREFLAQNVNKVYVVESMHR